MPSPVVRLSATAPIAAQQRSVVERFPLLATVSPQLPSASCVAASHCTPASIRAECVRESTSRRALIAVAVESALDESRPVQ